MSNAARPGNTCPSSRLCRNRPVALITSRIPLSRQRVPGLQTEVDGLWRAAGMPFCCLLVLSGQVTPQIIKISLIAAGIKTPATEDPLFTGGIFPGH